MRWVQIYDVFTKHCYYYYSNIGNISGQKYSTRDEAASTVVLKAGLVLGSICHQARFVPACSCCDGRSNVVLAFCSSVHPEQTARRC